MAASGGDSRDCESILNKLIHLTEQYKRLNELLENKQNMLRERANGLRLRRLKYKCDLQHTWITRTQIEMEQSLYERGTVPNNTGQATAIQTQIN